MISATVILRDVSFAVALIMWLSYFILVPVRYDKT
jgi:hypothetical protein